jgi:hypothetical protein
MKLARANIHEFGALFLYGRWRRERALIATCRQKQFEASEWELVGRLALAMASSMFHSSSAGRLRRLLWWVCVSGC